MSELTTGVGHKRTICEVHRELYDLAHENLTGDVLRDFTAKLEEAYTMGKKMQAKLRQYKGNYDENWWARQTEEIIADKLHKRANRK